MEADKSLNKIDPAGVNSGQEPEKEQTTERQETQEQSEQKDIQQEQEKQSPHSEEDQAKIADMTKRHIEWEKLIQSQREGYGNGAMLPSVGKIMRVFPKGQSVGAMLGMVKQISDDGKSVIVQLVNGSYYRFDLTDLQINKSSLIQFLVQKAKRRAIGEVYTQPSGKKVKKVGKNKFVEIKGKAQPKSKVHAAVKDQQSLNFAKQSNIKPEKEVKPVNRGTELKSHTVTGGSTEKASQTVTTGIKTHVGEVHHEMNTSHLNPKQANDAKEIYEKLKTLPESELRTRLERLKKLPNNGGAAGITAINHILNKPQVSSEDKTEVQEKVTGVNKVDDKPDSKPVSEEHAKRQKLDKVREAVKNKKAEIKKDETYKSEDYDSSEISQVLNAIREGEMILTAGKKPKSELESISRSIENSKKKLNELRKEKHSLKTQSAEPAVNPNALSEAMKGNENAKKIGITSDSFLDYKTDNPSILENQRLFKEKSQKYKNRQKDKSGWIIPKSGDSVLHTGGALIGSSYWYGEVKGNRVNITRIIDASGDHKVNQYKNMNDSWKLEDDPMQYFTDSVKDLAQEKIKKDIQAGKTQRDESVKNVYNDAKKIMSPIKNKPYKLYDSSVSSKPIDVKYTGLDNKGRHEFIDEQNRSFIYKDFDDKNFITEPVKSDTAEKDRYKIKPNDTDAVKRLKNSLAYDESKLNNQRMDMDEDDIEYTNESIKSQKWMIDTFENYLKNKPSSKKMAVQINELIKNSKSSEIESEIEKYIESEIPTAYGNISVTLKNNVLNIRTPRYHSPAAGYEGYKSFFMGNIDKGISIKDSDIDKIKQYAESTEAIRHWSGGQPYLRAKT